MRVSNRVRCGKFPCSDVKHERYVVPDIEVNPDHISIAVISEAAPANPSDYYYERGNPLFQQTTLQAFKDAGVNVSSIRDLVDFGVYFTTTVKCGKTGYSKVQQCQRMFTHLGERAHTISRLESIHVDGRCSDKCPKQHRKESW
jgi:hypothetical protein